MSAAEHLIEHNRAYAKGFDKGGLPAPPAMKLAVLTCMDARLDPAKALGIEEGDAHVIRNAGGVATDDALRSLIISQRLLGTEEIAVIHHTGCGMETFRDDELKDAVLAETGLRPSFAFEAFASAEEDVRQTAARIRANPFVPHKQIRGFLYDVETGELQEIAVD